MTDAIVIGGGLAGLTAAATLARAGRQVLLLERGRTLGGLASTRLDEGVALNLGPHALYRGGAGAATLRALGVTWSGGRPSGRGLALEGQRLRLLPSTLASLLGTGLLGLAGKWELARFLARVPQLDPAALRETSARAWLERELADPTARATAQAVLRVTTYAADLERLSADAALSQLQLAQGSGVDYLDGGWVTLVEGLGRAAAGAELRTRAPVRAVEPRSGGGFLVRTGAGPALAAGAVVLAVPPRAARALLPAGALPAAWSEDALPVRAACVDLVLRGLPAPRRTFALGIDRPLYWSVHTAAARLAPEGLEVAHALKYLPADPGSPDDDLQELEAMLDRLQPGWRARVVERRFLPRLQVASALPRADRGGLAARPGPAIPHLPGAFVAGDWVGGQGLLADASLASGRAAGEAALAALARQPARVE